MIGWFDSRPPPPYFGSFNEVGGLVNKILYYWVDGGAGRHHVVDRGGGAGVFVWYSGIMHMCCRYLSIQTFFAVGSKISLKIPCFPRTRGYRTVTG